MESANNIVSNEKINNIQETVKATDNLINLNLLRLFYDKDVY